MPTMTAPIHGTRTLPSGYAHAHASEQARRIAENGMVLRVQVGSDVHGTAIGDGDRDELGICFEPAKYLIGLARVPSGTEATSRMIEFEQYERHTAWDREHGIRERSGVGDLDVIIYSARKWAKLAAAGNPTVLMLLFAPDSATMLRTDIACELIDNADKFVSAAAAGRFLGYLNQQKQAMTGETGAHTNRPELVAVHGYDTKYAMHALRLGIQGVEFLTTGRITLPVPEPDRTYLRAIRHGEVALHDVLDRVAEADAALRHLRETSALPPVADHAWIDGWLHRGYQQAWRSRDA